uniref:Uncharacterized protein n=2 Tax=Oryza TaxID=4527 RepID=Q33AR9_ORYSJ|nr:hypothetical protein LOC_Os10g08490 [Oryza sativa Japonica Group]
MDLARDLAPLPSPSFPPQIRRRGGASAAVRSEGSVDGRPAGGGADDDEVGAAVDDEEEAVDGCCGADLSAGDISTRM